MENAEVEKSKSFIIAEFLEYIPGSVVIKTIVKKATGIIIAVSFDSGKVQPEKISPFDTFIQIIDGKAEIVINGSSHLLDTGQSIIIPAHCRNMIRAIQKFKMLATIIKSGYDE